MHPVNTLGVFYLAVCAVAEWEFPFEISQHFLRVIGGYPTFIDSYYSSVENLTNEEPPAQLPTLWAPPADRPLKWTCYAFPGDAKTCMSTVTSSNCRSDSQYSVGFWQTANHSCEKQGRLVPCVNVTHAGNICQDVVAGISNASTAHFILSDLKLPSIVTQKYNHYDDDSSPRCHHPGSPIQGNEQIQSIQAGASGHCEMSSTLIRFGVNTTTQCIMDASLLSTDGGCPSLIQLRESFLSNVAFFCNCGSCKTPLIQQPVDDNNSTTCLIPHTATLTFTHTNGYINGAYVSYNYRTISPREIKILLTTRTQFIEYHAPCQKTRFELQRGLFHCPSEVTCWGELWIPFGDLTQSPASHYGCAIIVLLASLLLMRNTRRRNNECDCRSSEALNR